MNANEISKVLRKAADILDIYGDRPLVDALSDIYTKVIPTTKKNSENIKETTNHDFFEITDEEINEMAEMTSDELMNFLTCNEKFKRRNSLMVLAQKLSISTSLRSSMPMLLHTIVKYFERQKLDKLISNENK